MNQVQCSLLLGLILVFQLIAGAIIKKLPEVTNRYDHFWAAMGAVVLASISVTIAAGIVGQFHQ